jgi:hypothetical protein
LIDVKENAGTKYFQTKAYFRGSMLGFIAGALVAVFPFVGIKRSWNPIVADQAQFIFFIAFVITMSFTGAVLLERWWEQARQCRPSRRQQLVAFGTICGALFFFLLFFAANALTQRLSIGLITGDVVQVSIFRLAGLICSLTGMILQISALIRRPANPMRLHHPCFFATLIFLTGVPLLFGSWFALFALPGIFIAMKWFISFPRSNSQPEEPASLSQKSDWQLIPFVY